MDPSTIVNKFCQKHNVKPEWTASRVGDARDPTAPWSVTLRLPGFPNTVTVTGPNQKSAKQQATAQFAQYVSGGGAPISIQPASAKMPAVKPLAAKKGAMAQLQNQVSQMKDSQFQRMLTATRSGKVEEASRIAQTELTNARGSMSLKRINTLLTSISCRAAKAEAIHFVDVIMELYLVTLPDEKGRQYFSRMAKWALEEIFSETQFCIDKCMRLPVAHLERVGDSVSKMKSAIGKGSSELVLTCVGGGLPVGHKFMKGDWIFLTYPHTGIVCGDPNNPESGMTIEAELQSVHLNGKGFIVKVLVGGGAGQSMGPLEGQLCRVDRAANHVTFSRQVDALCNLSKQDDGYRGIGWLRQILLAHDQEFLGEPLMHNQTEEALCCHPCDLNQWNLHNLKAKRDELVNYMNESQIAALTAALTRHVTLIQGPPGAGKTHSAVLLIHLWVAAGRVPVLVAAESNIAVDNILTGLMDSGIRAVRLGRPDATAPHLEEYNIENKIADLIEKEGGKGEGKSAADKRFSAFKGILGNAQVVCTTCSGAGHPFLEGYHFKGVIIDESAQATEIACLMPLLRLHPEGSAVLLGDHKQLQPMVASQEAVQQGAAVPLFQRLVDRGVPSFMLQVQYRMHPVIAEYPSWAFYEGKLQSGIDESHRPPIAGFPWPDPSSPVCFIEAPGQEIQEGTSYINAKEAEAVTQLIQGIMHVGELEKWDIGVITPYAAQVRLLRRELVEFRGEEEDRIRDRKGRGKGGDDEENDDLAKIKTAAEEAMEAAELAAQKLENSKRLEISSVDSFQGREKELIVVSTCRSNTTGNIGFLSDYRRLNVTITRARRGLVVIGNSRTLARDGECWAPWLNWVANKGLVLSKDQAIASLFANAEKLRSEMPAVQEARNEKLSGLQGLMYAQDPLAMDAEDAFAEEEAMQAAFMQAQQEQAAIVAQAVARKQEEVQAAAVAAALSAASKIQSTPAPTKIQSTPAPMEFEIIVKSEGDRLGLELSNAGPLEIKGIASGGLVYKWNHANPGNEVRVGDVLIATNGQPCTLNEMIIALQTGNATRLKFQRKTKSNGTFEFAFSQPDAKKQKLG